MTRSEALRDVLRDRLAHPFRLRSAPSIRGGSHIGYLSAAAPLDEVNLWQPSGNVELKAFQSGRAFLFKLHTLQDFLV
jgi:hypothetical protein